MITELETLVANLQHLKETLVPFRTENVLEGHRVEWQKEARVALLEELGRLRGEELDERVYRLCRGDGVRHRKIVWRDAFVDREGRGGGVGDGDEGFEA